MTDLPIITDEKELASRVDAILSANPSVVVDYQQGKPAIGFVVGQLLKMTNGRADAALAVKVARERLEEGGRE